jgi:hypothetical protein
MIPLFTVGAKERTKVTSLLSVMEMTNVQTEDGYIQLVLQTSGTSLKKNSILWKNGIVRTVSSAFRLKMMKISYKMQITLSTIFITQKVTRTMNKCRLTNTKLMTRRPTLVSKVKPAITVMPREDSEVYKVSLT